METRIDEIADGIYRLSTFVPEVGPTGFTFNQFLVDDEQPLLYHTGPRGMFPLVSAAIERITPMERLRWITFGHLEADECGSMNELLAVAPHAEVAHGALGCMVSFNDLCDRPPVPLADGEVLELGARRVRHLDTPHVPHCWEARALYEETTGTLFCGDLLSQVGDPAALTSDDVVPAAIAAEDVFQASSLAPTSGPTVRRLASLAPQTLAVMHGSSVTGPGTVAALERLADDYDARVAAARVGL